MAHDEVGLRSKPSGSSPSSKTWPPHHPPRDAANDFFKPPKMDPLKTSGWWCNNHLEKYESMGRIIPTIPYIMEKIFETTNQTCFLITKA